MKITKLILCNNKKIFNGTGLYEIMLNTNTNHWLNIIEGPNGAGKSTILSELTPLPGDPSDYINGRGQKSITIKDEANEYIITYNYYNGNRTSATFTNNTTNTSMVNKDTFQAVVEAVMEVFGLDANFEALTHLSSYDNKSFALLKPAERKKFLSSIINNLDVYNNIYKTLSKRSSIFKAMVGSINTKISNLGSNPLNFGELIRKQEEIIATLEQEKFDINQKLTQIDLTEAEYLVNEDKKRQLNGMIGIYKNLSKELKLFVEQNKTLEKTSSNLEVETLDMDIKAYTIKKNDLNESLIALYRIISDNEKEIRELNEKISQLTASQDYQEYCKLISDAYNKELNECSNIVNKIEIDHSSDIESFKKTANEIRNFPPELVSKFLKMYNSAIQTYQTTYHIGVIGKTDEFAQFKSLYTREGEFDTDAILTRKHELYELMLHMNGKNKDIEIQTLDFLDYCILNYDKLNELDRLKIRLLEIRKLFNIPKSWDSYFVFDQDNIPIFNESKFNLYYDTLIRYNHAVDFLENHYNYYSRIGTDKIDVYNIEIPKNKDKIKSLIADNESRSKQISILNDEISEIDKTIESKSKLKNYMFKKLSYANRLKDLEIGLEAVRSSIIPDTDKYAEYRSAMDIVVQKLKRENETLYKLRYSLDLYKDYVKELESLQNNYSRIETLKKYCSPSTGIQIIFIDLYIHKILDMANKLLSYFFNSEFVIQPFIITDKEFRIPIQGNGLLIDDISSLSSSQMIAVNMCISFAIMIHSSSKFNILRLDEVDAPFDLSGSNNFVGMLQNVMTELNCEQCFLITHSPLLNDQSANHITLSHI